MEAEVREISAGALTGGSCDVGLGSRIRQPFEGIGGVVLDVVDRAERIGRPISMADAQIAAICRSHGATVAREASTISPTSESTS